MNFGFVILHYYTIDDTKKCVDSIRNNVKKYKIVIVDNGSKNGTGKELYDYYQNDKNIVVIINEKNVGFANGNNIGIDYMKKNYKIDFLTVMNNDVELIKCNFENNIINEYKNSKFGILGPQIMTLNGDLKTNPVEDIINTNKKVKAILTKKIIKLILCFIYLDFFVKEGNRKKIYKNKYDNNTRYENVKLHGACLIFSNEYFKEYKHLNEKTFLYFEEDILYIEALKKNIKTVFNPNLKVFHKEDSSTNAVTKTNHKKNMFVLKNEITSLLVLRKIIKGVGED